MIASIFLCRTLFTSLLLGYAAWSDLSRREVENWVPLALLMGGLLFSVWDSAASLSVLPIIMASASAGVAFVIALAIFYAGSMGGADCKVFIGVSAVYPIMLDPGSLLPPLNDLNPFVRGPLILPMFSLSWLVNSLLVSMAVPAGLLLKNIHDYLRGRIPKVDRRTIPAFFVGYRAKVADLKPSFLIPLERFEEVGGKTVKVLRYSRRILDEKEEEMIIEKVRLNLPPSDRVWAFPYVPFIVPMLAGFFITLILGDLLIGLVWAL